MPLNNFMGVHQALQKALKRSARMMYGETGRFHLLFFHLITFSPIRSFYWAMNILIM